MLFVNHCKDTIIGKMMLMPCVATMLVFLLTPGVIDAKHLCICTADKNPVCGDDGKTYGNSCKLHCADVGLRHKGECPPRTSCLCPRILDYVCGTDGRTYDNECLMRCNYVGLKHKGECPPRTNCPCPKILAYVCGTDRRTYDMMRCNYATLLYEGRCIY